VLYLSFYVFLVVQDFAKSGVGFVLLPSLEFVQILLQSFFFPAHSVYVLDVMDAVAFYLLKQCGFVVVEVHVFVFSSVVVEQIVFLLLLSQVAVFPIEPRKLFVVVDWLRIHKCLHFLVPPIQFILLLAYFLIEFVVQILDMLGNLILFVCEFGLRVFLLLQLELLEFGSEFVIGVFVLHHSLDVAFVFACFLFLHFVEALVFSFLVGEHHIQFTCFPLVNFIEALAFVHVVGGVLGALLGFGGVCAAHVHQLGEARLAHLVPVSHEAVLGPLKGVLVVLGRLEHVGDLLLARVFPHIYLAALLTAELRHKVLVRLIGDVRLDAFGG